MRAMVARRARVSDQPREEKPRQPAVEGASEVGGEVDDEQRPAAEAPVLDDPPGRGRGGIAGVGGGRGLDEEEVDLLPRYRAMLDAARGAKGVVVDSEAALRGGERQGVSIRPRS